MKKSTLKTRLWALAATLLLLVSLLALPVSAANTPVNGGTFDFNKYLVMDANANVPNAEFEFTIDAGTAVAATDSSPAIYAGIGTPIIGVESDGTVSPGGAVFTPGDSTAQGTPTNAGDTTQKYATKIMTVDFSRIQFTAPGIYRYIITETASKASGITNDTVNTRTLDVYVQYKNIASEGDTPDYSNHELEVSGYVIYNGTEDFSEGNKSDGFTNTYTTYDLTLAKTVTGNQGDRDKYFEFSVAISNAVAGTQYSVDVTTNADKNPTVDGQEKTNPETLTVVDQGSVTATYYLKHGQSIKIQGLTADTKYTIAETSYSTDGYTTSNTVQVGDGDATKSETLTTGEKTMGAGDNVVTFTNDKQGTVPTGILLETAPYLILGAVVVAGLVVLFATRRRRSRE